MQTIGSFFGGVLVLAAVGQLFFTQQDAQARHGAAPALRHSELVAQERAEKLRTAGAEALAQHKLADARQALDESYQVYPASESLYYLGQLALAEGHPIEAQDLMRRFVHELGPSIDPQQKQEAARIQALPSQPYGELEVLGARGALVRVDSRLLGVLPLAQPLLLPSGTHSVQLNLGSKRFDGPVEIPSGRAAQLRFDLQTGMAVMTLPPTVLLVQDYGASPAPLQDALAGAADQATRAEQLAVLHPRAALVRAPDLTACVRTHPCQVQLMLRNEVDYAMVLTLVFQGAAAVSADGKGASAASSVVLRGELLDATMGDEVVLTLYQPIGLATPEQAAALLGTLVTQLLKEGRARPRGTLVVTSTPPGAQVIVPHGPAGVTPYEHTVWAGPYEVMVQKNGYQPARLAVTLAADKKETVQVNLEPLPGPPPRRPLWRTITGAIAIGVGGLLVLTNLSSLSSSSSSSVATGAGLVSLGSLVVGGGVLLLTLPVHKPKPQPPAASAPVP